MKNGRAAEKRQAWLDAARLYDEACALKPDDGASCQRAQEMRDYGIEIRTYRARQLCSEGQLGPCVAEFRPLLLVASNKQHLVQAVVDEAGALAISQCAANAPALASTLGELGCLQAWQEPLWRGNAFRTHFALRSRGVAGQFALLADSQPEDHVGARKSYLEAAQCVAPLTTEQTRVLSQTTTTFRQILTTPLVLEYTSNGTTRSAPRTCAKITEQLGRGLTCDKAGLGTASHLIDAHAEVFGVRPRWQRSHRDTEHLARYKSGTQQVPNPAYDGKRLEYELANSRHSETERDMREQERRCNDTQTTSDCDSFERLRSDLDDRETERDTARARFHRESPTVTEDVYKDHHYVTRHHEWVAPYRASVKLGSRDWAPEVTNIVYRDTEQTGFSPAGIQADPFEQPAETYYRDRSSSWLTGRISQHIESEMTARAQALVAECNVAPMECWARARFWNGETGSDLATLNALAQTPDGVAGDAPKLQKAAKHELRCTASLLQ